MALHLEKNVFPTNISGFKTVTACLAGSSATPAVATNVREEKEEEEPGQTREESLLCTSDLMYHQV